MVQNKGTGSKILFFFLVVVVVVVVGDDGDDGAAAAVDSAAVGDCFVLQLKELAESFFRASSHSFQVRASPPRAAPTGGSARSTAASQEGEPPGAFMKKRSLTLSADK